MAYTRLRIRRVWVSVGCLRLLIVLGIGALIYYFSWWQNAGRIMSLWLGCALALAALYHWAQLLSVWLLYLSAHRRSAPPPPSDLTVDVFVTVCKEPVALVERAVRAAVAMDLPHKVWLLDDGADPQLARLAKGLGAYYLTREGRVDAKAGNLNAALARTNGDVIAVFDVDHAPHRSYLTRSIGYFRDPSIGFVQVMLTFINAGESWVARAAIESGVDFYNPTSLGMDGVRGATMEGSNSIIRRAALLSIGGYQPGLAEDLATSVALHAAGWQSAYVAEPLAPGIAPPDLTAWFTQQLKWARGVFEVLLTQYPRLLPRLTWGQRLSYAVRMTYYLLGPVIAIHLAFTVAMLLGGTYVAQVDFQQYLLHYAPLAVCALLIRQVALRLWRHPSAPAGLPWRAVALVFATWPIYTVAFVMALVRVPLGFRPTPKTASGELKRIWLMPQLLASLLLLAGIGVALAQDTHHQIVLLGFAALQIGLMTLTIRQGIRSRTLRAYKSVALSTRDESLPTAV